MGFVNNLRAIRKQAKEIDKTWDPGAQMREGLARMQQMNQVMAAQTEALELERVGVPATGTVIALTDTGSRLNFNPVVRLSVLVEHGDRPPYPVTKDVILPVQATAQACVGQRVALLVDPADPQQILVRWGQPAS